MRNATLVYSSKWCDRRSVLSYEDGTLNRAVNSLIDNIFYAKRSNRVEIRNNKYYYTPSNEYKSFVVRMRKIK